MRRLVRAAVRDPLLAETAARIVGNAPNDESSARRLREWLAEHTRFRPDPRGVELIKTPRYMLAEVSGEGVSLGDCDDVAVLAAALGKAAGHPARFVLYGFRPGEPYEHVFTELGTGAGWLELDTTRPAQMPPDLVIVREGVREV